ncbi:MAG: DUF2341 domain-containing protein, partial [Acidaminococcaceae bacterium]|nr:DUF2341 domain-containing protein [Acidaminococcaceae bacterium]
MLLPSWIESQNSTAAVVWVKIPLISSAGTSIYLYSDNASASSISNGYAVFDLFDDFESGSTSNWTIDSGVSFTASGDVSVNGQYSGKFVHGGGGVETGVRRSLSGVSNGILEFSIRPAQTGTYQRMNLLNGVASSGKGTSTSFTSSGQIAYITSSWTNLMAYSANQWYKVRISAKSPSLYDIRINDQVLATNVACRGSFSVFDTVSAYGYDGGTAYYDNVFVRKYSATEPVHGSWGSAELQVLPPVSNFNLTPESGRIPLTVYFTDLSLHRPTSWLWNFGDNSTSAL